jgi:GGDEF domain-containing protein
LGGEEFVVLLRETGLGSAFLLAERLRQQNSGGKYGDISGVHPLSETA